jgi:hypothetical protein
MTLRKMKKVTMSFGAATVLLMMALVVAPSFAQQNPSQGGSSPRSASSNNTTTMTNITATEAPGSVLKLSRASIPINIPLEKGYQNESELFFIATDASDQNVAAQLTNRSGFKVNFAPLLAKTPEDVRNQAYVFRNGLKGNGPLGFQLPVISAKPGDEGYSSLWQINLVDWKQSANATELKSVQQIMDAQSKGDLAITKTEVIVNHPVIQWNGGSLKIREDKNITDDSQYVGGQVLNIDTAKMVVTMVAHRGWGPDGKTIYYLVTDATPDMPAAMMGVSSVPNDVKLAPSPVAVDLFQFMNGIKGSGPMGFQAGIGGANPDDSTKYSPMWKISFIEWKDPSQARVLENMQDVNAMLTNGSITLMPAMEGKHVVNCPFFDVETVMEHMSK